MKVIDLDTAVALTREALRDAQVKHGRKVSYADIDPEAAAPDVSCRYFNGAEPACIVGQVLHKLGVTHDVMAQINDLAWNTSITSIEHRMLHQKCDISFTADAAVFLRNVQARQDRGDTWEHSVNTILGQMGYQPPVDGDIGEPLKEIELEPFPESEPVQEPAAPQVVPEPEKLPA